MRYNKIKLGGINMIARVYKNGDKKFAASFGKVYRIDENGKAYAYRDSLGNYYEYGFGLKY